MGLGRVKRWLATFCVNRWFVGLNDKNCQRKCKILRWYGYAVGENTRIVGPVDVSGNLQIGSNVFVGKNFTVHGNGLVVIENNCDIAPDVTFLTGTHEVGVVERRAGQGQTLDTTVGVGTWIGARTTILPGVKIGKGCVIGAGSLINRDVPDNTMVAGVPAKVIKQLQPIAEGR